MMSGIDGKPEGGVTGGARFTVDVRVEGDTLVLAVGGELDHDSAGVLRDALTEGLSTAATRIVVDCKDLTFCDSTGLNVLLHGRLDAQEAGVGLELATLRPPVARMFDITGAAAVFRLYDSLDEALTGRPQE
ncbi:STAS domain-containing protein [Streptomyces sp. NPDC002577]